MSSDTSTPTIVFDVNETLLDITTLEPLFERVFGDPTVLREWFAQLIAHALKSAGCSHTLLADSGLEILRQASKGLPRHAGRILRTAMRLAVPRGLNHLPDDLLQLAIEELR